MKADFHIHSTFSDGSASVSEIIRISLERGLDAIAITDHDTLAQREEIRDVSGLKILCGIEISAIDKRNHAKAHVLGYHIQNPTLVESVTHPLLEKRHQNSLDQIQVLKENGLKIEVDQVQRGNGKYIYKQHIMEYLVKTHQVSSMFGVFYQKIFKNGGVCDFDIPYIDVFEAVEVIKAAGGVAVLAHPGQQKNFYLLDEIPFDGVEYNHCTHKEKDKIIIRDLAQKHKLFLTGGSDYHGSYESVPVQLGAYSSPESGVHALC